MKILLLFVSIAVLLFACDNNNTSKVNNTDEENITNNDTSTQATTVDDQLQGTNEPLLITDSSFAGISANSNYDDLQKLFPGNLKDEISYGAEGVDSFMVTKIYSNSPKEIIVYWKEGQHHKKISSIETYAENAPYYTTDQLKIGSTLKDLLEINGKPISFYGTGWDYGGFISSFNKGKFENANINFQLSSKEDMNTGLLGDKEFKTDMPLVKQNLTKLYIAKIFLSFEK